MGDIPLSSVSPVKRISRKVKRFKGLFTLKFKWGRQACCYWSSKVIQPPRLGYFPLSCVQEANFQTSGGWWGRTGTRASNLAQHIKEHKILVWNTHPVHAVTQSVRMHLSFDQWPMVGYVAHWMQQFWNVNDFRSYALPCWFHKEALIWRRSVKFLCWQSFVPWCIFSLW